MKALEELIKYVYDYFMEMCGDNNLSKRISSIPKIARVACGESILEAGHRTNYICLVISGLVRGFYIDEEGKDITKCFSMKGDWCCSYNYLSELPCPFFIEASEDTILARFDVCEIDKIIREYPVLEERVGKLLAESMMESERRIFSFTSLEAKDRYLLLLKEQPELVKRAKQEHIASYLGITPSSLSRIKRSI